MSNHLPEDWQQIRCPHCNKLLLRVLLIFGITSIEIKCPRCSKIVTWPDFRPANIPQLLIDLPDAGGH